jgi:hypothetical protein
MAPDKQQRIEKLRGILYDSAPEVYVEAHPSKL